MYFSGLQLPDAEEKHYILWRSRRGRIIVLPGAVEAIPGLEIFVRNLVRILSVSDDQLRNTPGVKDFARSHVQMLSHKMSHMGVEVEIRKKSLVCVPVRAFLLYRLTDDYPKKVSVSLMTSGICSAICVSASITSIGSI